MRAPRPIVRTSFWPTVAVFAACLLLAGTGAAAPSARSSVASYFQLVLDGADVGLMKSMTMTTSSPGTAAGGKKAALAGELDLQLGLSMKAPVFDWLNASLQSSDKPRSGAVVSVDASGTATQQVDFSNAFVTELTFPALDAASKAAGQLGVKLAGNVRTSPGGGLKVATLGTKQKAWLTSSFRLELDPLDTSRVSKIDALTFRRPVGAGGAPGAVQTPALKITSSVAAIQSWQQWQERSVATGDDKREGRIVLLGPDLKSTLGELKLHGVGIHVLRTLPASNAALAKFEAELYFESAELVVPGAK